MLSVIILAGGFARRLRPVSDYVPKPLLLIDGVPLIEYILRSVLELDYDKIIISTNAKFENAFRYWMKNLPYTYNGRAMRIFLSVEPSTSEEEKLGAVGGLWYTIKLWNVDINKEDILVILGDNLFDFDLKEFIGFSKRINKIVIGSYDIKNKEDAKRYGVLEVKENKVIRFYEKPSEPVSTLISTGIYYIPNEKINLIKEFLEKYKKVDAIGKLFEYLVEKDEVYTYVFKGNWFDIGTPEAYEFANKWASERNLGRRWLWP